MNNFIKQYSNIISNGGYLGQGKDNKFYWIYYAGMGSYGFSEVSMLLLEHLNILTQDGTLYLSDKTVILPIYTDLRVSTATFKIWRMKDV